MADHISFNFVSLTNTVNDIKIKKETIRSKAKECYEKLTDICESFEELVKNPIFEEKRLKTLENQAFTAFICLNEVQVTTEILKELQIDVKKGCEKKNPKIKH